MPTAVKTYDAKMDSKKRITLRNALYEYYHVEEFDDGRIVLEPRELVPPFQISEKSLASRFIWVFRRWRNSGML